LADSYSSFASLQRATGKNDEALASYQKAIQIREKLAAQNPSVVDYQDRLASDYNKLALFLRATGRRDEALISYEKAIEIGKRLVTENPTILDYQYNLAGRYHNLGNLQTDFGQFEAAMTMYQNAIEVSKRIVETNPAVPAYQDNLARHYCGLAKVLSAVGDTEKGLASYQKALSIRKRLVDESPTVAQYRKSLASLLHQQGKLEEAIGDYRELLRLKPGDAGSHNSLAWLLATAADPQLREAEEAVAHAKKAVELAPRVGGYFNTLGVAQYRAGDYRAAIEALKKSMELGAGGGAHDFFFLAMAYWQLGDGEESRRWYEKAVGWMAENKPDDEELRRFQTEAAELLGISDKGESEETGSQPDEGEASRSEDSADNGREDADTQEPESGDENSAR
jgi:tetratricopeptide (TPR) repeat protein